MKLILTLTLFSTTAFCGLDYKPTYQQNKTAFLQLSEKNIFQSWPLKSDANLTTDLTLLKNNSEQLLIISSGLHGIEGFVGSAIQREILQQFNKQKNLKKDILFIHALNPWGMAHRRRTNEDNIDLNRNFSSDRKLFLNKNNEYLQITDFLNPYDKVDLGFFSRISFFTDAIKLIIKYSIETLRKSILLGQYSVPKGLYYGGGEVSELQIHIDKLLDTDLAQYKKILWIDLHTGYGAKEKLHLLLDESASESAKQTQKYFTNTQIDFGDQKNFYKSSGDLVNYLVSKSKTQHEINAIVFEYGTMDSQKTLGSIESLRRMVLENQGAHFGYQNDASEAEVKNLFEDMFFPQSEQWKSSILIQTQKLILPLVQ